MGVYINMEMPKNCEKCIYSAWSNFYQIYTCNAIRKNEPVIFDEKQVMSTAIVRSRRADNCPLVPVPPHGRLIDADETYKAIKNWLVKFYSAYEQDKKDERIAALLELDLAVRTALHDVPTILAEEGELDG